MQLSKTTAWPYKLFKSLTPATKNIYKLTIFYQLKLDNTLKSNTFFASKFHRAYIDTTVSPRIPVWGSKTKVRRRNVAIKNIEVQGKMAAIDPKIEEILSPFRERVKIQGDIVREMKAAGKPDLDVKKAVQELKVRKKEVMNTLPMNNR